MRSFERGRVNAYFKGNVCIMFSYRKGGLNLSRLKKKCSWKHDVVVLSDRNVTVVSISQDDTAGPGKLISYSASVRAIPRVDLETQDCSLAGLGKRESLSCPSQAGTLGTSSNVDLSLSLSVYLSVCLSVCPSVRPSVRPLTGNIDFGLGWGSQGQRKAKPLILFSRIFFFFF